MAGATETSQILVFQTQVGVRSAGQNVVNVGCRGHTLFAPRRLVQFGGAHLSPSRRVEEFVTLTGPWGWRVGVLGTVPTGGHLVAAGVITNDVASAS